MPRRSITPDDAEFTKELGQRIAAARARAGVSLRAIAAVRGYSFAWLQKIETGQNQITALDLVRVADHLRVPVEHLIGRGTTIQPDTLADFRLLFEDDYEAEALYAVHAALKAKCKSEGQLEHRNRTYMREVAATAASQD